MNDERTLLTRLRVLAMLNALEVAGATPVSPQDFHAFAYFTNVLSPVWEIDPLEGSVLKNEDGPYFPEVQREIDYLISHNAISVSELAMRSNRILLKITLNYDVVEPILEDFLRIPDEKATALYLEKLAFAFVEISPPLRDESATVDASWSDPSVTVGRVIDFGEWVEKQRNAAWNATQKLQEYAPEGVTLNKSEKLLMYMRLMGRRLDVR